MLPFKNGHCGNDMLLVCIYGGNHKPLPVSNPVPLPAGQTSTATEQDRSCPKSLSPIRGHI